MVKRKGFGHEFGSATMQILRSLASWVGLESYVDGLSEMMTGYDFRNPAKLQEALTNAVNKLNKQYNLKLDNINSRLQEFYSLPKTRNFMRAIQQESKKLKKEKEDAIDEYNKGSRQAEYAQTLLNDYSYQNDTKRAFDAANYAGNIREAINKIEQPAGSNIGQGKI